MDQFQSLNEDGYLCKGISIQQFKCGSFDHKNIKHQSCSLNNKKLNFKNITKNNESIKSININLFKDCKIINFQSVSSSVGSRLTFLESTKSRLYKTRFDILLTSYNQVNIKSTFKCQSRQIVDFKNLSRQIVDFKNLSRQIVDFRIPKST